MKKTQKNLLGLAGLILVAAMTFCAVILPGPGVTAVSTMTDTITVRVISSTVNVEITNPKNGKTYVDPNQSVVFNYDHAKTATVTVEYTDPEGHTRTETVANYTFSEDVGSITLPINFIDDFGYGDFVVKVEAKNADGVPDEDLVAFSIRPVTGDAAEDNNTGDVNINLNYDEGSDDLEYLEITVFDKNGDPIPSLSKIKVPKPAKAADLPFAAKGIPSGEYTIEIAAFDAEGNPLNPPYYIPLNYVAPNIPVPASGGDAPNTGGLLVGLNISKSDYLITGLIVFFLVGICGVIAIGKNRQDRKRH